MERFDHLGPIEPFDDDITENRWIKYKDENSLENSKRVFSFISVRKTRRILVFLSVTVLFITGYYVANVKRGADTINSIYERYYTPFMVDSDQKNHLMQAVKCYKNEDYDMAVKLFYEASQQKDFKTPYKFYLAVSYTQCYKFKEAVNLYEEILESGNVDYLEDACWYLGLCYLKKYEIEKATEQFAKLTQKDGKFRQSASEIIELLNKSNHLPDNKKSNQAS